MTTFDPIERTRRARRRAASGAALVALACALVLLVLVRVWAGRSGADAPERPPSAVVDDGGLRWQPFRPGQDLPESSVSGPTRHVDGLAAGFERSELGAALAAIHIAHRLDPRTGPAVFENTIRDQVVGADAGRLRDTVSAQYESARRELNAGLGEALDPGPARLVAYKPDGYSPDQAAVTVISAEDNRPPVAFRFEVRWVEGDWKLVAPPGGNISSVRSQLQALPVGAVALSRGS